MRTSKCYYTMEEVLTAGMEDLTDLITVKRESRDPNIKTREELEHLLQANSIWRGSKSWEDYGKAKELFTGGEFINQTRYHDMIRYTVDYLNL